MPDNPFTSAPTILDWSNVQGTAPTTEVAGGVALNTTQSLAGGAWDRYEIIGADDQNIVISLVLSNS